MNIEIEITHALHRVGGKIHQQRIVFARDIGGAVALGGDTHHKRTQCFSEHMHLRQLQLKQLMFIQPLAALPVCAAMRGGHVDGGVANAQCVGCVFQITELAVFAAVFFVRAIDGA